ncbi:MAG: cell division protein FtsZ [bacterium]
MAAHNVEIDQQLEDVLKSHKTKIRIVGIGGGGNNTVTRLLEVGIKGVEVIAVNTDAQDLLFAKADHKILIGKNVTSGLGAGSDPVKGAESAQESLKEIEGLLNDSDMVFVTCGLGGGTGTGASPVLAEVAKMNGALTIAIVTLPFGDEGIVRWENAQRGLEQLQQKVDTVIVVQNDRLLDLVPDMSLNAAFKVADEILVNAVKGITELVTEKGLVNLDFADVKTIMKNGGLAMIGLGESDHENNAEEAAQKALKNPLLDVEITGAKNALINITGGQELSLKSSKTIMKIISERLDPSAKIIWGARLDESMGQSLRVMLIVTCLQSKRRSASEIDMVIRQTGRSVLLPIQKEQKEVEVVKVEDAEPSEQVEASTGPQKHQAKQVFSEIFLEDCEADITRLRDAVKGLAVGENSLNEKYLREIKSACTSLYNTAELFSYPIISEFAEVAGEVTDKALSREFDLTENLITIYQNMPAVLDGLLKKKEHSREYAEEIKIQFTNILKLFEQSEGGNEREFVESEVPKNDNQNKLDISEAAEITEQKKDGEKKPEFSNVRDAVKYIDKLL